MKQRIKLLFWVALVSLVVTSIPFWFFEHGANPEIHHFFDVIWWWVVTSTTLGYGDIVPATGLGRVVSIVAIITGFFVYTNAVAIIAESVHGFLERKSCGHVQITARNHIVICEYTAIADELIQVIPGCRPFAGKDVVIVTALVPRNPYPQHHFVNGVPINPAALRQANVGEADYIFVFANLRFADPDVKTMHVASRVIDQNRKAKVFVELINPQHELLKYAPPGLIALDSHELIESVLRDKSIDPVAWLRKAEDSGSRGGAGVRA